VLLFLSGGAFDRRGRFDWFDLVTQYTLERANLEGWAFGATGYHGNGT
jgi:hypothetical protein